MHCGVMVTGYNQGDWHRLMAGDYDRPPDVARLRQHGEHPGHGRAGRAARLRLDLGDRALRLGVLDAAQSAAMAGLLGRPDPAGGRRHRGDRGAVVEPGPPGQRDLDARHPPRGPPAPPRHRPRASPRTSTPRWAFPSRSRTSTSTTWSTPSGRPTAPSASPSTARSSRSRRPPSGPRPATRASLTTNIKAAFTTETSARLAAENGLGQMFVSGDDLAVMTGKVRKFNEIRAELGLPPDQPTTLLWMYCAETQPKRRRGGSTSTTS